MGYPSQGIVVLGTDGNLWLENGPFGAVPPARAHVDANVRSFRAISAQEIFVCGTDGKLWLERAPFGNVPPQRTQVDASVQVRPYGESSIFPMGLAGLANQHSFQPLSDTAVGVLGQDGNLWLEFGPFGNVPPQRNQIDANVANFQVLNGKTAVILGTDGKLWLEQGPFGKVPPARQQIDANVSAFQAIDANNVFVLGTDRNLWLERAPFGHVPPARVHVDANVVGFQAIDANNILILGTDQKLWLSRAPFGNVPPPRTQVDANVSAFQAIDLESILVLGTDRKLWIEEAPFGSVPPRRTQVDGSVAAFQALDTTVVETGTVRPLYQILTVVYAPPGTAGGKSSSQVVYGSGSTTGTTTSTSHSFKAGVEVDASASFNVGPVSLGASADFSTSTQTTDSSSVAIQKSESYTITVSGPGSDGINHDHDLFYLWLNPLLNVTMGPGSAVQWGVGVDGPTMNIQYVYAAWLKNPSTMPANMRATLTAAGLTDQDFATILATNPFGAGQSVIDPNRYLPTSQSFPYIPPFSASDPVPTTTYQQQNVTTSTTTQTKEVDYGVKFTASAGIKTPLSASLSVTTTFNWTNTNSTTNTNTTQQTASVTVGGPSFGFSGPTDVLVYWDTIFSSFLFAFPSEPPSASGSLVDPQGRPIVSHPVTLAAGGRTRSTFTDAAGAYRFYGVPAGTGRVSVGKQEFTVPVGPHSAAVKQVVTLD